MQAGIGKILIRFKKDKIERFEREQPKHLTGGYGRIIVKDYKSFSYQVDVSIEIGEVAAINSQQKNLKVGDNVLLSYLIFINGRYDQKNNKWNLIPHNQIRYEPNGDEIYYANDGTDGFNSSDIYAKITAEGIEMLPGYIIINEPKKIERIGLIYLPDNYKENRDDQAYWATVLNINPIDKKANDIEEGDRILCRGGFYYEIKASNQSIYIIRPRYILAKNLFETYA
jgi:co-chaperonin GroES (HSP10)